MFNSEKEIPKLVQEYLETIGVTAAKYILNSKSERAGGSPTINIIPLQINVGCIKSDLSMRTLVALLKKGEVEAYINVAEYFRPDSDLVIEIAKKSPKNNSYHYL